MSRFKDLLQPVPEKELKSSRRYFKESLRHAKESSENYPEYAEGNRFYASHYFNMAYNAVDQHDEALLDQIDQDYKAKCIVKENWDYHIQYNRACLRISQHRFKEAIKLFKKLIAEKGIHHTHCIIYLIDIYEYLEDYKSAANWIHKYFVDWRKEHGGSIANCSSLNHYLSILAQADEYENVIKYGLERIERNYRSEQYLHFLVAQSYLNLKDLKNALKYYGYIFKRKIPYPEAYANLGAYYSMTLGDHETAAEYMIKAANACGTDMVYKQFLYNNVFRNFSILMKLMVEYPEKTVKYRRNLFEAMPEPLMLSDLIILFTKDRGSMDEYRLWLAEQPQS